MPEFEEPETPSSSQQNYTPSTDASKKPRTRRRSGGFKTEQATQNLSMGEVDPVVALKEEKLSGSAKPAPEAKREPKREARREAKRERPAPKAEATERRTDAPKRRTEARSSRRDRDDDRPRGNAQPSPETLAAIKRVEERLDERKKERDARHAEREKNRPARSERSDRSDRKPQSRQTGPGNKKPSGGIIASILSFFGIGAKPPAKKSGSGKPSGNRGKSSGSSGQGSRPRGKSGNQSGSGQNRRGGNGGKGRRSSGGNRPRRNDNHKRDEQS